MLILIIKSEAQYTQCTLPCPLYLFNEVNCTVYQIVISM